MTEIRAHEHGRNLWMLPKVIMFKTQQGVKVRLTNEFYVILALLFFSYRDQDFSSSPD